MIDASHTHRYIYMYIYIYTYIYKYICIHISYEVSQVHIATPLRLGLERGGSQDEDPRREP